MEYNIGDKVYIRNGEEYTIIGRYPLELNLTFYLLQATDSDDKVISIERSIFSTKEEAIEDYANDTIYDRFERYKEEIQTVSDLLKFPLNHDLQDESFARAAYRVRADQLLGINILE